jgi:hypothetical protein
MSSAPRISLAVALRTVGLGLTMVLLCSCVTQKDVEGAPGTLEEIGAPGQIKAAVLDVLEANFLEAVGGEWTELANGTQLAEGTYIRTGDKGFVDLGFDGTPTRIHIGSNSYVDLARMRASSEGGAGNIDVDANLWYGEIGGLLAGGPLGSTFTFNGSDGTLRTYSLKGGEQMVVRLDVTSSLFQPPMVSMWSLGIWGPSDLFVPPLLAIPEPSVWVLFGLGGIALLCVRRNSKTNG